MARGSRSRTSQITGRRLEAGECGGVWPSDYQVSQTAMAALTLILVPMFYSFLAKVFHLFIPVLQQQSPGHRIWGSHQAPGGATR